MNKYKVLFCLENEALIVIEIKRLGLPEGTEKSKVYSWLLFEKKSLRIDQLVFKAMNSDGGKESRSFEQAELQFDSVKGTILLHGKEYLLIVNDLSEYVVSPDLGDAINTYLAG